ncbi:MAG: hypothetical protein R6W78_01465 [Bacteroidales bacterium]
MKKNIVFIGLLVLHLCYAVTVKGQYFEKSFGYKYYDYPQQVLETSDLNFMIFGSTKSDSLAQVDAYLVKVDAAGDTLWSRSYGGSQVDAGIGIAKAADGGFLLVVTSSSVNPGNYDIYLLKINDTGDTLWTRTYGGPMTDYAHSVTATSDGGYAVLAHSLSYGSGSSDFYLLRLNKDGDTLWTRTYGGSAFDWGACVKQTSDGGFILAGDTQSHGDADGDVYLVKTNSAGDTLWTRIYGGDKYDRAYHVIQTKDNGYLLSAVTNSYGNANGSGYLIKTDEKGDTLWTRIIEGAYQGRLGRSLQTSDGNYIVMGSFTVSDEKKSDIALIKVDTSGSALWTKYFGGSEHDQGADIIETTDQNFFIVGATKSFEPDKDYDFYIIKTNGSGTFTNDDEFQAGFNAGDHSNLCSYPNPFRLSANISYTLSVPGETEISIYDAFGCKRETLVQRHIKAGTHTCIWNAGNYPGGVYFCILRTEKNISVVRLVYQGR